MGKYEKTKYPGVFKYAGRLRTSYGIDYYSEGRKHREIVGPLIGEARTKLEQIRTQSQRGGFVSLAHQRKVTFDQLLAKYAEVERGKPYFEKARKYSFPILLSFFGASEGRPGRKRGQHESGTGLLQAHDLGHDRTLCTLEPGFFEIGSGEIERRVCSRRGRD